MHLASSRSLKFHLTDDTFMSRLKTKIEKNCRNLQVDQQVGKNKEKQKALQYQTIQLSLANFKKNKERQASIGFDERRHKIEHNATNRRVESDKNINVKSYSMDAELRSYKLQNKFLKTIRDRLEASVNPKLPDPPKRLVDFKKTLRMDIKNWTSRQPTKPFYFVDKKQQETKTDCKFILGSKAIRNQNYNDFFIANKNEKNNPMNDKKITAIDDDEAAIDIRHRVKKSRDHRNSSKNNINIPNKENFKPNHTLSDYRFNNMHKTRKSNLFKGNNKLKINDLGFKNGIIPSEGKKNKLKREKSTKNANNRFIQYSLRAPKLGIPIFEDYNREDKGLIKEMKISNLYSPNGYPKDILSDSDNLSKASLDQAISGVNKKNLVKSSLRQHIQKQQINKINYLINNLDEKSSCYSSNFGIFNSIQPAYKYDNITKYYNSYWLDCINHMLVKENCLSVDYVGYYRLFDFNSFVYNLDNKHSNIINPTSLDDLIITSPDSVNAFVLKLRRDIHFDHENFVYLP